MNCTDSNFFCFLQLYYSWVWSCVSGGRRRDCWMVWGILSRNTQLEAEAAFFGLCPVLCLRLVFPRPLCIELSPAPLSIHLYCKAKLRLWPRASLLPIFSITLCLPNPLSQLHSCLCWQFRSTFVLKLNQMKTNLLPDSCAELCLIHPPAPVKLPHSAFLDFSPWGPC